MRLHPEQQSKQCSEGSNRKCTLFFKHEPVPKAMLGIYSFFVSHPKKNSVLAYICSVAKLYVVERHLESSMIVEGRQEVRVEQGIA